MKKYDSTEITESGFAFALLLPLALVGCKQKGDVAHITSTKEATIAAVEKIKTRPVLYRSLDAGKSWKPFDSGIPSDATVNEFATSANKIYVATEFHGIFVTINGENNWKASNQGLPAKIEINTIAIHNKVVVIGSAQHGVFTSRDEGKSWMPALDNIQNTSVRALIAWGGQLWAGTDKGIYGSTDDGDTWRHVYGDRQVNGFTVLHNKIYAGLSDGAIVSGDHGQRWNYIFKGRALHDISNDGIYVYAMTLGSGLLRTDSDGQQWDDANQGMGAFKYYTFEVKNMGNELFAGQWQGIYHSMDHGKSWLRINNGQNGLPDSTAYSTLEVTEFGLLAGIGLRK